ncbi:XP_029641483.1uncharacterized protein LOC115216359 [Octopus vulgaris]|uniref:XP_029641483.1uncharacterized protein LOC115216359 n=1 Tax=Octopus vulgaris TaxID=6645 RepID=A0AA36F866_OCTVU|nr:XP_029641483.1uncharacterized protein LOC115216359 [Octopus vulgaris]
MEVTENSQQKSYGISASVTILRPKSPTKSICDKNFITFMETNLNESFSNEESGNSWEEILCAFSAPFLFRSPNGSFLPNVNMQMYWCNFCRFKCQEKQKMIEHSQTHRFKCNYCDKESYLRKDIIKHSMKVHNEYNQIRQALKSCALLDDYLAQKEMTLKEQSDDFDKITTNEHNYFATYNISKVTSTEPCQSSVDGDNSTKECEDIDNITPSILEMPSNSLISETTEQKSLSYDPTKEQNLTLELNSGASQSVSVVVDSYINSTMNLVKADDANNTASKSQPSSASDLKASDTYSGPLIVSVQSLHPDSADKSNSSISHTEVSTTDLNTPTKRKREGPSDSDSYPEDEDIDPDYDPEEYKPNRRISKRRLSERLKTSGKSKHSGTPVTNLPPGTKFWRCRYCKCRSSKIEKIVMHLKAKHSNKPLRFISHIVGKNGQITELPEKSLNESTTPTTPKTEPTPVENKVKPSISETKTIDLDDKKEDKQYLCFFCDTLFSNMNEVRQHMFKVHPSRKFYCIDTALKEQNKEYHTFFCCRHKCNFVNVDPEEYVSHVEKCTPIPSVEVDPGTKPTGLQQTVLFAKKLISQKDSKSNHSKKKHSHSKDKDTGSKKTDNSKLTTKDTLYSCHSCDFSASGNTSIKSHILSKHPDLALSALVKKENNSLEFYFFCSKLDCDFVAQQKSELIKHSKEKHGEEMLAVDSKDIDVKPKITAIKTEDSIKKSNVTYMPAYECLYCESSCISTSLTNMKRHVQEAHPSETIVVRDCIAYKCKRPSRIYVCDNTGCIFNDLDYKQYLIHVSAHKDGVMYECLSCPTWASQDKDAFVKHVKKESNKKHSLAELQTSMKPDGSIVLKKADGTTIEQSVRITEASKPPAN